MHFYTHHNYHLICTTALELPNKSAIILIGNVFNWNPELPYWNHHLNPCGLAGRLSVVVVSEQVNRTYLLCTSTYHQHYHRSSVRPSVRPRYPCMHTRERSTSQRAARGWMVRAVPDAAQLSAKLGAVRSQIYRTGSLSVRIRNILQFYQVCVPKCSLIVRPSSGVFVLILLLLKFLLSSAGGYPVNSVS